MKRCRGLTLIELIVFIVIVSVGLAGVLSVLNLTAGKSADPIVAKQALAIAEAMLEEILAKDYQNDPADPGNTSATLGCTPSTTPRCAANTPVDRPNYNDVDDFRNWDQTGIVQQDGSTAPLLPNYRVQVGVSNVALSGGVSAKRIEVTVSGDGNSLSLAGFRTDYE